MMPGKMLLTAVLTAGFLCGPLAAWAQDAPPGAPLPEVVGGQGDALFPATTDYAPYRVVLNKAEILDLPKAARTIIITNPTVIDISLENARMGILRGLTVGESALIIMDADHNKLFTANVIVIPEPNRHVTVTRDCTGANKGCAVEEEFSCGPRCVRVINPNGVESANGTNAAPGGSAGGATGGGATGGGAAPITDPAAAAVGG